MVVWRKGLTPRQSDRGHASPLERNGWAQRRGGSLVLRWFASLAAAGLIGAAAGSYAGRATVADLRADLFETHRLAGAYGVPIHAEEVPGDAAAETARLESDCTDCSDFQVGYDWAITRQLRRAAACAVDSWSFQQGCEAAVREVAGVSD